MSEIYEDDSGIAAALSKTIKINDCIKVGKRLGANSDHITKLVRVKDHTRTWIKNVEKAAKSKSEYHHQYLVNIDTNINIAPLSHFQVTTPLQYFPALPVSYNCSFCLQHVPNTRTTIQYHNSLSHPYVLLCSMCADKG